MAGHLCSGVPLLFKTTRGSVRAGNLEPPLLAPCRRWSRGVLLKRGDSQTIELGNESCSCRGMRDFCS
jgi:hypothetical protein